MSRVIQWFNYFMEACVVSVRYLSCPIHTQEDAMVVALEDRRVEASVRRPSFCRMFYYKRILSLFYVSFSVGCMD